MGNSRVGGFRAGHTWAGLRGESILSCSRGDTGELAIRAVWPAREIPNIDEIPDLFARDRILAPDLLELCGAQLICWDVAERRRLEQALALERDLLHALMDNVPDDIYFKDASSRFIRVNHALTSCFGLSSPDEAVGKTDADLITTDRAETAMSDEQEVLRTGTSIVAKTEQEFWPDGRITCLSGPSVREDPGRGDIFLTSTV